MQLRCLFRRALAALLFLAALPAFAFPDQPIKLIVGFPPGGGGDLYGRLIAQAMTKSMGHTVLVDNRPGAAGNIAADVVAKSKPDGHTILLAMSGNFAVAPVVRGPELPYKVPEDFTMIGAAVEAPHGLFVAADSPHKTAQSFFAAAKNAEVSVGSTSPGGAAHIGLEMVKLRSKAKLLYVPYRGSGPAITDLLGGQIEGFFATAPPIMSQVKSGKMRLLAVTGDKRNPSMPEVPTFLELGIPVVVTQWYGLAAPAGTPAEVVALLSRHLSLALADPEVKKKIRSDGAVEKDVATEAFRRYVVEDIARYRDNIDPAVLKMTK